MTSIINAISAQFNGAVSAGMILAAVLCALACGLFIDWIYKKTYSGVAYSRSMSLTILLLSMVTAIIIRTINSNLSLSLGMVGALSIVRFRTAVKDPVDTAFLFWAITAGIMSGAGLYLLAVLACLLIGLVYYLVYFKASSNKPEYLLVLQYDSAVEPQVNEVLNTVTKKQLKSKSLSADKVTEVTFRISQDPKTDELLTRLQAVSGVRGVHLVSYNNEYGL